MSPSSRELPLTQGKVAIVDAEDFDRLIPYRWHAFKVHNTWYAATQQIEDHKRTYLHRFIMDAPKGMEVDHISGDGLDNRKENMRVCTHRENLRNIRRTDPSLSGYRGVVPTKHGRYVAKCKHRGKTLYWGTYATAIEAARVRDRRVIDLHGEFAVLNFPREDYEIEPTG